MCRTGARAIWEGHVFFLRRITPAMRRAGGHPDTTPCSSSLTYMIVVSLQPGSIVTVLVSESVWGHFTVLEQPPPGTTGSPLRRPALVPLCIAPHACAIAPGDRPLGRPDDVGPEGHPPFVGRNFRACRRPGTGPALRPSRRSLQHTMPESGRMPGPSAGPGFQSPDYRVSLLRNSFRVPHPGTDSTLRPGIPGRVRLLRRVCSVHISGIKQPRGLAACQTSSCTPCGPARSFPHGPPSRTGCQTISGARSEWSGCRRMMMASLGLQTTS